MESGYSRITLVREKIENVFYQAPIRVLAYCVLIVYVVYNNIIGFYSIDGGKEGEFKRPELDQKSKDYANSKATWFLSLSFLLFVILMVMKALNNQKATINPTKNDLQ